MERDPEEVETRVLHAYADLLGTRVLEIGCGEGRLIWRYAATAARVVGLDPDAIRLAAGRQECPPLCRAACGWCAGKASGSPLLTLSSSG